MAADVGAVVVVVVAMVATTTVVVIRTVLLPAALSLSSLYPVLEGVSYFAAAVGSGYS